MSDTRERAGAAGVVVAGTFFKIVLYICVIVLLFWVGKASYQFGHDVFNQQAMSPGEGQEVTVVIKEDTSLYKIAKTLQKKGLVGNSHQKDSQPSDHYDSVCNRADHTCFVCPVFF